jgi:hypothetical protein
MNVKQQPRRLTGDNPLSQPLRAVQQDTKSTAATKPKAAKPRSAKAPRQKHTISISPDTWKRLQLNAMAKGETASGIIEQLIISHTDNVGITRRKAG